jgi:hypothetical protein
MKQQWMAGLAAVALAAGLLLTGTRANAQPRRNRAIEPRAAPGTGMLRQRTTPGAILSARRPAAYPRYWDARRVEFGHPRLPRFRHYHASPFPYYYYAPPPAYYYNPPVTYYYNPPVTDYYSPPVTYYYAPSSGDYYLSPYSRRRHHRYRVRVAGYRGYYAASTPPGWHRGRKRGWRGRSVPPGHFRRRR